MSSTEPRLTTHTPRPGARSGLCSNIVNSQSFWSKHNASESTTLGANRDRIVSAIGRLLESGAKSDDHAFEQRFHGIAETLLVALLDKQAGRDFEDSRDAVFTAINSPRGHCIQALIDLSLRECRIADSEGGIGHIQVWLKFEPYYEREFLRLQGGNYEFSTLLTNYLPNFLYMSRDWVLRNLGRIFPKESYRHWLCAMQGYAYTGNVYHEVYRHLKEHGDFIRALDDEILKKKVSDKIVQNIFVAYLNNFETLEDEGSLINVLLRRNQLDEMNQLIWFVWTIRKKEDLALSERVFRLWHSILSDVDTSTKHGRLLASNLCQWSVYVERLDHESMATLLRIAPFADDAHNSAELLRCLAKVSRDQPFEANEIWRKMLEEASPEYPEESIRQILSNLIARGEDGRRAARETVSEYLKHGVELPDRWLKDIVGGGLH